MARINRRRNVDWETPTGDGFRWEHVAIEVLMDIRDELQQLNRLMHCPNAVAVPRVLKRIDKRLAKKYPLR